MQSRLKEVAEQNKRLVETAWGELQNWRSFLIAIDGRDNSGKSTLARFLAWQMDMPAIETDLFLVPNQQRNINYRDDDLRRLIKVRLDNDRPVIVEGIFLLEVLKQFGFEPNYLVYAENQSYEGSNNWQEKFAKYEEEYTPRTLADFVFSWSEDQVIHPARTSGNGYEWTFGHTSYYDCYAPESGHWVMSDLNSAARR